MINMIKIHYHHHLHHQKMNATNINNFNMNTTNRGWTTHHTSPSQYNSSEINIIIIHGQIQTIINIKK